MGRKSSNRFAKMARLTVKTISFAAFAFLLIVAVSSAHANEAGCKSIEDARARFRCTDEYATSIISRAKVAVRKQLREPDLAVFYNMQIKQGGEHVCGEFDLERDGKPTGLRRFAFDGKQAHVLLRNTADGTATSTKTLEDALDGYDQVCKFSLPVPHRGPLR